MDVTGCFRWGGRNRTRGGDTAPRGVGLGGAGSGGEVRPWSSAVELGGGNMRETKFRDHFWVSGGTVNWGGGERGQDPDGTGGLIAGGGHPFWSKLAPKLSSWSWGAFTEGSEHPAGKAVSVHACPKSCGFATCPRPAKIMPR